MAAVFFVAMAGAAMPCHGAPYEMGQATATIPVTADVSELGKEQSIETAPIVEGISIDDWREIPAEGYATIEPAGGSEDYDAR